jgi:hypothetical protein
MMYFINGMLGQNILSNVKSNNTNYQNKHEQEICIEKKINIYLGGMIYT